MYRISPHIPKCIGLCCIWPSPDLYQQQHLTICMVVPILSSTLITLIQWIFLACSKQLPPSFNYSHVPPQHALITLTSYDCADALDQLTHLVAYSSLDIIAVLVQSLTKFRDNIFNKEWGQYICMKMHAWGKSVGNMVLDHGLKDGTNQPASAWTLDFLSHNQLGRTLDEQSFKTMGTDIVSTPEESLPWVRQCQSRQYPDWAMTQDTWCACGSPEVHCPVARKKRQRIPQSQSL